MLALRDVTIRFGGLAAVSCASLDVAGGRIHSIIGPNGAGKTTLFNAITSVVQLSGGSIRLCGERIDGLAPYLVARRGIARTYQNIRLFSNMTVLDNILVGREAHPSWSSGVLGALLRTRAARRRDDEIHEHAFGLLENVGLTSRAGDLARTLSYGDQRRLEIARALATDPKLLLLDEPAAGMNAQETRRLIGFIDSIRERYGLTILLIEHQMQMVMGISQCITVLEYGQKIAEGTPDEIRRNPDVIRAYLGSRVTARAMQS